MSDIGHDHSRIADPLLQKLYEYWETTRDGRSMPSRDDLDPVDMRFILGHVALIDVLRHPLQFRVRLQGTELVRWTGSDLTGQMLDELRYPETRAVAHRCLTAVVESGFPYYAHENRMLERMVRRFEVLVLPLSVGGTPVAMLLAALRCGG
jgi:hypothetical protein